MLVGQQLAQRFDHEQHALLRKLSLFDGQFLSLDLVLVVAHQTGGSDGRSLTRGPVFQRLSESAAPLKHAPHTQVDLVSEWQRPYSREEAVFPLPWVRDNKFWPSVNRIDDVYGDRNLFCACMPIDPS